MRTKNHVAAVAMVAVLAACATTKNYERILESWVGAHVDDLVHSWGPPDYAFELSSGGKIIEYEATRNVFIPGSSFSTPITTVSRNPDGSIVTSTTYVQHHTHAQNFTKSCTTRFNVETDGTIAEWEWEGNDCIAETFD